MKWDVTLDGTSIKSKVKSCRVTRTSDAPTKECTIEFIDRTLFHSIDWTTLPAAPQIDVLADTGSGLQSIGQFFIERPTYSTDPDSAGMRGIWGRSKVALLAEPFAKSISKTWGEDNYLYDIVDELLDGSGVTFDRDKSDVPNFLIGSLTYSVDKAYPLDSIIELAELCGGWALSDNSDNIYLKVVDYQPSGGGFTADDNNIEEYSEEIIFPEFGNRIKVSSEDSEGEADIALYIPDQCLLQDGSNSAVMYARVSDKEDRCVSDAPVYWAATKNKVTLRDSVTTTGTIVISDEEVQSEGFNSITLEYPPGKILSAYWKKDEARSYNYAAAGYEIDGNEVTFYGKLKYCDQTLIVTYEVCGVAVNYATALGDYGTEVIRASITGASDTEELHIGDPCACMDDPYGDESTGIEIVAVPAEIGVELDSGSCSCPQTGCVAKLLISVYEAGAPISDGRTVYCKEVTEDGPLGELKWTSKRLGRVLGKNLPGTVEEELTTEWRCKLNTYIDNITKVEWKDPNTGEWSRQIYLRVEGKNVYIAKRLTSDIKIGDEIRAEGVIQGVAVNYFTGKKKGTAKIEASCQGFSEEPIKGECEIKIGDCGSGTGDDPENPDDPNDGSDPWDPNPPGPTCYSNGSYVTCGAGESCCEKDGAQGCHPSDTCDGGGGAQCRNSDCSESPTSDCLEGRFGEGLADDCTCQQLCEREMADYGTTQSYDGGSYRTIKQIVENDYGLAEGSPGYYEKYNEIQQDAINSCRDECGDCESAPPVVIEGSDATIKPGGYGYSATGGIPPYTWSVKGTGVSIDENGNVTLADNACGSYYVTCTDSCGNQATASARITNAGGWGGKTVVNYGAPSETYCSTGSSSQDPACLPNPEVIMSGDTRQEISYRYYVCPKCSDRGGTDITPSKGTLCGETNTTIAGACPDTGSGNYIHQYFKFQYEVVSYKWYC